MDLQAIVKAISVQVVIYLIGYFVFYDFFTLSSSRNYLLIILLHILIIGTLIASGFVSKDNQIVKIVLKGYNNQPILGLFIAAVYLPQSMILFDSFFLTGNIFIIAVIVPIIMIPLIFYFVDINWKEEVLAFHLIILIYPLLFYLFYNYINFRFVLGGIISLFLPAVIFFTIYMQFRMLSYRNYTNNIDKVELTIGTKLPIISILLGLIVQSLYFLNFVDETIPLSLHILVTLGIFVVFYFVFIRLDSKILVNILRTILIIVYISLALLILTFQYIDILNNAGQSIGIQQNGSYFFVVVIPFGFITLLEFLIIQQYRKTNRASIAENTNVLYPDTGVHGS